ncbi:MAG: lysine--tRNA ligase [bacterium]|nr:lysine--tRNA ligase [bacterium]
MNTTQQSNHWLDAVTARLLEWQKKEAIEKLHVDDMKTPSGRVHTGALRGVVLHDLVAKALSTVATAQITNTYVFNDMDPMDGLPSYLPAAKFERYMGVPLYKIPAPSIEESGVDFSNASAVEKTRYKNASSFAEFYAFDFIDAFQRLGCSQEIIWSHELYESGKMDTVIKTALDSIEQIRTIYKEVADYQLPDSWYPFQVTCPTCGKVGTTLTTNWDGKEVSFECQPSKVTWAKGCGHKGSISPFGGTGKLLWKVDWPGHWTALGVTVEGAGKDHTSAGGSRDMANALCARVFGITPPFDIPYEWILIRGAKMSSSKGVGTSAREFVQLFPPTVGRFLFASKDYNQVIDFDPASLSIPDLFDEYDQGARIFWKQEEGDQRLARAFELSQNGETPTGHFLPRFRDVALWMQHPEIDLVEQFSQIAGAPLSSEELEELELRRLYAEKWVQSYAPTEYQLRPKAELPEEANALTQEERAFLRDAIDVTAKKEWDPAELQQALFELAKRGIGPRKAFQAIYLAFLGKKSGPRAAWFLLSIEPGLRTKRIAMLFEKKQESSASYKFSNEARPGILTISDSIRQHYPSLIIGTAIIKGVTIAESSKELRDKLQSTYDAVQGITTAQINESVKIQSYRQAIKQSGIDWHSRRPTMDALLRRIGKGQLPPSINNVADIGNLLAVKHQMSQGLFDFDKISTPIIFKEAVGGETAILFGSNEPLELKAGEICYFDAIGPFAVDLCWRDSQRTSVTENTTNLLIQTEGVFDITRQQVETMLQDLIDHITQYAGGVVEYAGITETT